MGGLTAGVSFMNSGAAGSTDSTALELSTQWMLVVLTYYRLCYRYNRSIFTDTDSSSYWCQRLGSGNITAVYLSQHTKLLRSGE
jgi:hypothetical protein